MPDSFENRYEDTRKQIDTLDKSIDDLGKNQERIDFTECVQEVKNIYDSFVKLDKDISSITDENKKNELKKRLDDLKIKMLDLVSDGSIDNLIDGKTKDEFIDKEIMKVNDLFRDKIESLIQGIKLGYDKLNNVLSEPLTENDVIETFRFSRIPLLEIPIEGKSYPGFGDGKNFIVFDGVQFRMCEPIFDDKDLKAIYGRDSLPKGVSITKEPTTQAGIDAGITNLNKYKTKLTQPLYKGKGWNVGVFESMTMEANKKTPYMGIETKIGNTGGQISYSPGKFSGSEWNSKATYKGEISQKFKWKDRTITTKAGLKINDLDFSELCDKFYATLKLGLKKKWGNILAQTDFSKKNKPSFSITGKFNI